MDTHKPTTVAARAIFLATWLLAGLATLRALPAAAGAPTAAATPPGAMPSPGAMISPGAAAATTSYAFSWSEDARITVVEYWNAASRAGCDYANNPWPQAELAAQRAYVLGARQVLADEWHIGQWIAANRSGTSQARIHGAETNCPNGHVDFPPHVHVFYLNVDASGNWRQVNSHHYPNAQGKIDDNFIIPGLCVTGKSYHPAADAWVDMPDEQCTIAWQQRFTSAGDLELRRASSATTYTLRIRSISGDLSSLDVLAGGNAVYSIDIVAYDPITFRMVARIKDYQKRLLTTETWWGDPARGANLAGHTTTTVTLPIDPGPTDLDHFVWLPVIRRP